MHCEKHASHACWPNVGLSSLSLRYVANVNRDSEEFSRKLEHALEVEPKPMTAELQRRLTWEDATERFLDVAELKASERPGVLETAVDKLAWVAHNTLTGTPAALTACNGCKNGPLFFKLDTFHCIHSILSGLLALCRLYATSPATLVKSCQNTVCSPCDMEAVSAEDGSVSAHL